MSVSNREFIRVTSWLRKFTYFHSVLNQCFGMMNRKPERQNYALKLSNAFLCLSWIENLSCNYIFWLSPIKFLNILTHPAGKSLTFDSHLTFIGHCRSGLRWLVENMEAELSRNTEGGNIDGKRSSWLTITRPGFLVSGIFGSRAGRRHFFGSLSSFRVPLKRTSVWQQ